MADKYREGFTPEKVIVEVETCIDDIGNVFDRCPRCHHLFRIQISRIQFCSECGQHISPKIIKDNKEELKKQFIKNLTLEDLENQED